MQYRKIENELELCEKIVNWKAGMEVKGLKVNTGKMKVVFDHSSTECRQGRGAT